MFRIVPQKNAKSYNSRFVELQKFDQNLFFLFLLNRLQNINNTLTFLCAVFDFSQEK